MVKIEYPKLVQNQKYRLQKEVMKNLTIHKLPHSLERAKCVD